MSFDEWAAPDDQIAMSDPSFPMGKIVGAQLYGVREPSSNPGFDSEVSDPVKLATISMRIDEWSGGQFAYVGLTDYEDVRKDDKIRVAVSGHQYEFTVGQVLKRLDGYELGLSHG